MKVFFPARRTAGNGKAAAFSLVEVTIAIAIFAFVVVGILGLLPTAMKMRAESAQETRAVLIAQELLASVQASPSLREVTLRDGPGLGPNNNQTLDITSQPFVIGYPVQTTVPYWLFRTDADAAWETMPSEAAVNDIETMARLRTEPVSGSPDIRKVIVEVRSPASIPAANTTPVVFTTYAYSP
jgi:type II secretory pathway pseudopilin PulG